MNKFFKIIIYYNFNFFFIFPYKCIGMKKLKIGLLVPMTGENKESR